jgi:Flp pilus assembly protein TadG
MTGQRARAGERGQILVFTAVSLLALMGIAALSIDAAYLYDKRNRLYAAADAAAKSAAFAKKRDANSNLQTFANHEVAIMGITGATVDVHSGPWTGPYTGNLNFVEVIVSQPNTATFFGKLLGWMSANPGARAVAGGVSPVDCIIINEDLALGRFTFTLNGCGLSVGRNLRGNNPTAEVIGSPTPSVNVGGTCSGYCSGMGALQVGAPPPTDPFAYAIATGQLSPPTMPTSACGIGSVSPLPGGCYSGIAPSVTTLQTGGNFYITGTVNIDSLTGDDVFVYLTKACAICGGAGGRFNVVGQNKTLHLTAHTTGPYTGMAVWQDAADTEPFSCISCPPSGNPYPPNHFTIEWGGAIYMPGVDQEFRNHMTFTPLSGCGLFVARNLAVENGNGGFDNTNCGNLFGGAVFLSTAVVE